MSRQQGRTSYIEKNQRRTQAYVEGNTVRRLNTMPEREYGADREIRERENREREQDRRARRAAQKNRERAMQMSPAYLVFLTLAVILTVGVCVCYIQLQSDISSRMRNIASLESQILDLQMENDAAMKRIETSVDLDEIKNTAMNEMGMVYPGEEQIIYFTVDTNDYMNQYQDIPEK